MLGEGLFYYYVEMFLETIPSFFSEYVIASAWPCQNPSTTTYFFWEGATLEIP